MVSFFSIIIFTLGKRLRLVIVLRLLLIIISEGVLGLSFMINLCRNFGNINLNNNRICL